MRIISKYKDFYDFLAQDYDADITYTRTPFVMQNNYDKLYCSDCGRYGCRKSIPTQNVYWFHKNDNEGKISINNYVFGIFPNVYSQPYLEVTFKTITDNLIQRRRTMPRELCEKYLANSKGVKDAETNMATSIMRDIITNGPDLIKVPKKFINTDKVDLERYLWKVECPDIFMKIGAPVFVNYDSDLLGTAYDVYNLEERGEGRRAVYAANICFNKLTDNVLKYWFDELNDLNTYINIENFLWATKQEPEHIPDNNTKIINHGFDLKTSFRKM